MAIVSKVNRDGIDIAIEAIQQKMYANLLGAWDAATVYTMYPRANKNYDNDNILPEISLDKKDYKETLYDDKVFVNSFFLVNDDSVYNPDEKTATQNISLIFQADLVKLYGDTERVDEVFNADVLRVLDLLKRRTTYVVGDITVTRGFDKVYSDLTFTSDFKDKIKYSDISHRHIVKFTFDVIYKLDCNKAVTPVCAPVTINVNGEAMTAAESGTTVDVTIKDTLGVDQGVRTPPSSFDFIVPAGVTLDRVYYKPPYSGQTASYRDGDTKWRLDNEIGKLVQPTFGTQMFLEYGKQWLLTSTNIFLHLFRYTGTTGGYYNPSDSTYYDVSAVATTRALAFPDDILCDHLTSTLWQVESEGTNNWNDAIDDGLIKTIGSYTGWYLPSSTELQVHANRGVTSGFRNDNTPFMWGASSVITGDTYVVNSGQAWGGTNVTQITPLTKANNNQIVYMKEIDFNTEL